MDTDVSARGNVSSTHNVPGEAAHYQAGAANTAQPGYESAPPLSGWQPVGSVGFMESDGQKIGGPPIYSQPQNGMYPPPSDHSIEISPHPGYALGTM